MRRGIRKITATALLAAFLLAACAPAQAPPTPPPPSTRGPNPDLAPRADDPAYVNPGPYAAGVMTVQLEPGRDAEIWYPAPKSSAAGKTPEAYHIRQFLSPFLQSLLPASVDPTFQTIAYRGLPASRGPFPMVLFSHGFASYRLQSTFLTAHLATWGFVVISPDYLERGLQSLLGTPSAPTRTDTQVAQMAVDQMISLNQGPGPLQGRIDTSRLFPVGHSAGGSETTALASRTDVQSWIALSAGIDPSKSVPTALNDPNKAALWMVGAQDHVASPTSVRDAFTYTAGPAKLVVLPGGGHVNDMSDICEIAKDQGGVIGLARSVGLPIPDFLATLATDGCVSPPAAPSAQEWPIVRQFVTAELRYRSGLDKQPVGLGSGVVNHLGPIVAEYHHNP
jgi:dienelactone hydrolase